MWGQKWVANSIGTDSSTASASKYLRMTLSQELQVFFNTAKPSGTVGSVRDPKVYQVCDHVLIRMSKSPSAHRLALISEPERVLRKPFNPSDPLSPFHITTTQTEGNHIHLKKRLKRLHVAVSPCSVILPIPQKTIRTNAGSPQPIAS